MSGQYKIYKEVIKGKRRELKGTKDRAIPNHVFSSPHFTPIDLIDFPQGSSSLWQSPSLCSALCWFSQQGLHPALPSTLPSFLLPVLLP